MFGENLTIYIHIAGEPEVPSPIAINATLDGELVGVEEREGRYLFVQGTLLTLTCNGTIGRPVQVREAYSVMTCYTYAVSK